MPNQITEYGAQVWMAAVLGAGSVPSSYWVALASDEPGTAIDGTMLAPLEPTDANYGRVEMLADSEHWGLTANGLVSNLVVVDFGIPDVSYGLVAYFVLCSAETGGELFAYGEIVNPTNAQSGTIVQIPIGSMSFQGVSNEPSIVT